MEDHQQRMQIISRGMARWPLEKDTTKIYIMGCKEEGIEYHLLSSWDVKRLPTHEEHSIQLEKEDKAVRSRSQEKEETISTLVKLLKDNPNTACTSAQDLAKKQ